VKRRERGVAVLTAILVVAVSASAAALMLAQQSAMVDQAMLVASRAQADLYARTGLDWARGVLQQDARSGDKADYLGEGWAQPIAALPVERAIVSGFIIDEQGKLNLNNLVRDNARSQPDILAFQRLLASLGLSPDLAEAVVDWIDADSDLAGPNGAEDQYYLALRRPYRAANAPMMQVEELYRVRGFDAAAVAKLRPFVSALPAVTAVNVNTAPAQVLAALLPDLGDRIGAQAKVRDARPLRTRDDIKRWAGRTLTAAEEERLDVASSYFYVRVQVAQDDVELSTDALVARTANGRPTLLWRRPRY
jgi:general secretion pathway protein K